VTTYSLHPGVVHTELGRYVLPNWPRVRTVLLYVSGWFMKTPVQGAQTSIYCATEPDLHGETGKYYRCVLLGLATDWRL
jgi:retinol dehydrogenase-12